MICFIWNQQAKPQNMSQGLFKFMTEQLLAIDAQCPLIAVNCAGCNAHCILHAVDFLVTGYYCKLHTAHFPLITCLAH